MSSNINEFSEKSRSELFIKCIRFFDWKAYKSNDKELYKLSDNQLFHHILYYGIPKKTILFIKKTNKNILPVNVLTDNFDLLLPKDFDWNNYVNLNKDIKNNEIYAKVHYILYGNYENRKYKTLDNNLNNTLDHKLDNTLKYTSNIIDSKKILIINPKFGVGNRLRAIASAYSICKSNNIELIINWIPDDHCDCLIDDLIININEYGKVISNIINISSLTDFKFYNYMENEEGGKKDEYIDINYTKLYIKSNCALNNKNSYTFYKEFLLNLKWSENINNLINSIPEIHHYIGMHIRMEGGAQYTSQSYEKTSNWTSEETELLFKYREISHIDNFINQINNILHKNPEQKFFIATDMKSNYEKLINIYGSDKIKILERNNFDRSKEQLYYAVADIILLSKCKQFYGSTWSSFSELVTQFQEEKIKKKNILSDKFKIQNLPKTLNYFNKEIKQGNSIVSVSMNRSTHILKVLPSWLKLKNCDEIIILDYGSKEILSDILKINNFTDKKIKVFRVNNVYDWHLSKAYNLAIKLVNYKNIYKLDSDDICHENMIVNHPLKDENDYYHGKWQDARNNNELQIAGKMFFTYNMFIETNGYNENITTYGWDDCEFNLRLKSIACEKPIKIDDFTFIEHNDNIRLNKNNFTPEQYIHINRLLTEDNIIIWSKHFLHTNFVIDNEGIFNMNECYHVVYDFLNKEKINKIITFCVNKWK